MPALLLWVTIYPSAIEMEGMCPFGSISFVSATNVAPWDFPEDVGRQNMNFRMTQRPPRSLGEDTMTGS